MSLQSGKIIQHEAYVILKCWLSRVMDWMLSWRWHTEGLCDAERLPVSWLLTLRLPADWDWSLTSGECLPCIDNPGKDQNSKSDVQFLLNAYHCHIIVKLRNSKWNHRKSVTICTWLLSYSVCCAVMSLLIHPHSPKSSVKLYYIQLPFEERKRTLWGCRKQKEDNTHRRWDVRLELNRFKKKNFFK